MTKTHLLVIDPQNDFCDLPEAFLPPNLAPALAVAGAHLDMLRLAEWIDANRTGLEAITVTLDHHHRLDIAHPPFWRQADGTPVAPFTTITAEQARTGQYRTAPGIAPQRAIEYLERLEATGRHTHMVWPIHCQIGTWGQCVHATLQGALDRWEDRRAARVEQILKGENPWTEHYSALCAEIPDPTDPATGLNLRLLETLHQADLVLVAGEAGSHCVRATVEHLVENWRRPLDQIVLLTDAMSPVTGFEATQAEFLATMATKGLRTQTIRELNLI